MATAVDMEVEDDPHADLPSEDEQGPTDPDDDDDAMAPGDDELSDDGDPAMEGSGGAGPTGGSTGTGPAPTPPALPMDITTLKVDELKEHLRWRALPTTGKKSELQAALRTAVDEKAEVLSSEACVAKYGGGDGGGGAPRVKWVPIEQAKIDRPA